MDTKAYVNEPVWDRKTIILLFRGLMGTMTGYQLKAILRGLSVIDLQMQQIKKSGEMTCWAGCYRMIDVKNSKNRSFRQYLQLKNPSCTSFACELTPCSDCDQARSTFAVQDDLKRLGYVNTLHETRHLNEKEIKLYLRKNRPLIVFKDNGPEIGHFLIVSGIGIKSFFMNQYLIINDPDKMRKSTMDLTDLCLIGGVWTQTWVVQT